MKKRHAANDQFPCLPNMAAMEQHCFTCEKSTKYHCITCGIPVCNRCSIAEMDDDTVGWLPQRSVAYCNHCSMEQMKQIGKEMQPNQPRVDQMEKEYSVSDSESISTNCEDVEESTPDSPDTPGNNRRGTIKKTPGRKSVWQDHQVDDLVDVIVNDESFKRNLIFTNVKKQKNTQVYSRVLDILTERYSQTNPGSCFPFNVGQIRTKFKWCVSTCKKLCLTIQTATGIKRVQDEKGYGQWFNLLYPLIKSRDSCQPDQAIEPDATNENMGKEDGNNDDSGSNMFVPVKNGRSRKRKTDRMMDVLLETGKVLKAAIENDPTKDILALMREEMQQAREQDKRFNELMATMCQQPILPNQVQTHHAQPPWYSYNNSFGHQVNQGHRMMPNPMSSQSTQSLPQQSGCNEDTIGAFSTPRTYHQM